MRKKVDDNPSQGALFEAPLPPPPPKVHKATVISARNLPKLYRVRLHPFSKFADFESFKSKKQEVDVYLKKLRDWSKPKSASAILVEFMEESGPVVLEVHWYDAETKKWASEIHCDEGKKLP